MKNEEKLFILEVNTYIKSDIWANTYLVGNEFTNNIFAKKSAMWTVFDIYEEISYKLFLPQKNIKQEMWQKITTWKQYIAKRFEEILGPHFHFDYGISRYNLDFLRFASFK